MLILSGILAYFALSAYLSHNGFMTVVLLGAALWCLGKAAKSAGVKLPQRKQTSYPPLQDSNLDRVRYVQVNFKDWRKKENLSLKWEVSPERRPGHYEFFFDSRIMVDSMMEKQSIVLYDVYNRIIPLDRYGYSWEELEYSNSGGDGCATLKVYPRLQ